MTLVVRRVTLEDSKIIFNWRNDSLTRKMFKNSKIIKHEEHTKWISSKLTDSNHCLLMCEFKKGQPLAFVHFGIDRHFAEISINLSPTKRGEGLSAKCLELSMNYFKNHYPAVSIILAKIKTINIASKKSFEKVGFVNDREEFGYWHLSFTIKKINLVI